MKWNNYMHAYIPSLLGLPDTPPIPPLLVITEHQTELPELYRSFPLAVCFTRDGVTNGVTLINMLIPGSQSVHPALPLCVCMSVLYLCVSAPALQIGSSVPFF